MQRAMQDLKPSPAGAVLTIEGGMVRPPMVRSDATRRIYERARRIAEGMGLLLPEAASGGASDGNFCAALGVPVLDGLGAVGGGAHATDEHVKLADMPIRSALVANLIRELSPAAEDDS
jgi:glutamate carboxypeptidase